MSWAGTKPYEIRRDDRGFEIGDTLILRETVHSGANMERHPEKFPLTYTGRTITAMVASRLVGYGIERGWVILGLKYMECSQ